MSKNRIVMRAIKVKCECRMLCEAVEAYYKDSQIKKIIGRQCKNCGLFEELSLEVFENRQKFFQDKML